MSTFSPTPSYLLGSLSLAIGLHCLLRPSDEYHRFGIPLENTASISNPDTKSLTTSGTLSVLMYLKGIREISYGLALIALQFWELELAVTLIATILSLASLGDGFVVWSYGGKTLQKKAFGHWIAFVGFAAWSGWRILTSAEDVPKIWGFEGV
ncbi:hypothetical protein N7462_004870 [Penicillium macrosclerotiorum]|uniref:uncharacterized protein n=1 Tax=Penicillium macrosclerotiorum TaxID=303699 RepID=UPI002547A6B5|nr:uncharacterized protein N7462_004870 [Penicillium macrosclerotiorum]KAJ5690478.1 hypothetical protein N7462_004870 [Penicillium macrosclerotiorum]